MSKVGETPLVLLRSFSPFLLLSCMLSRKEACSGAIADSSHARTEHSLSDSLTKKNANPKNLWNAVRSGWLKELYAHPPFRSMLEHTGISERLAPEGAVDLELCFVSMLSADLSMREQEECYLLQEVSSAKMLTALRIGRATLATLCRIGTSIGA